jgi:hypothetical protein
MVYRPIAAGTPPRLPVHGEAASDQAAGQATHRRLPRGKAGHRQAAPPSLARDKQDAQIAQLGREANDQANDQTAVHIGGSEWGPVIACGYRLCPLRACAGEPSVLP